MAQLVVRNLDIGIKARLKKRAQRNGRSMEEEVREILRNATVQEENSGDRGLGTAIAAIFAKHGLESEESIPEFRGISIEPPSFEP